MQQSWRPTAAIARALTWMLAAYAVVQVLAIAYDSGEPFVRMHDALSAQLDGRTHEAERIMASVNDSQSSISSLVNILAVVVTVLLIVWAWRSAKNARALGRTGERISPTLGIFGWFIPLASWVIPYLLVSDLWRSSDPTSDRGTGWRSLPATVVLRAWWVCFAGGQILLVATITLAVTGEADVARVDTLLGVAHTVTAIGAVLTIPVVLEVTRRQGTLQMADPAPMTRVAGPLTAPPLNPGEPGWYADPSLRFEQRYWDGSAWTERVLDRGALSVAPVTPADWYPDPTGRFPLRYWTGYAWTEHVSRGDDLLIDPVTGG